jgi:hypothetical protein
VIRALELGSYIAPAYAGMALAEQGVEVTKWYRQDDPILDLRDGEQLWEWINHGKRLECRHPRELTNLTDWHIVVDNMRPAALQKAGLDPPELARRDRAVWVSIRADVGDTSFDIIAQARSWMEYGPWMPLYLGDTCAGLWAAFKALAARASCSWGHHVIGHAACLQKLVEGELVLDPPRDGKRIYWDRDPYYAEDGHAIVGYRDRRYCEPVRDREWKLAHFPHEGGRIKI